ncbi:MAG: hypothetical protein IPN70_04490 [Candidatus Moraniibacteriota bacterium]|nr:MAG: hypothetical protein IPN70_04490 [Candidatus Moranbacteria bacterium]
MNILKLIRDQRHDILASFLVAFLLFSSMEALFLGWKYLYVSAGLLVVQFFFLAIKFSQSKRDFLWAFIAILYSIGSCGVLFFVSSNFFQQIMIFGSSLFIFFASYSYRQLALSEKKLSSQGVLFAMHFLTLFLFFGFFCAVHINYSIPQWLLAFLFGGASFFVSLHSFLLTRPTMPKDAFAYSFVMGFLFFQFAWFVHFWPFGYLTISAVLLVTFFCLWDLLQTHMEGTLRKQRFLMNTIFFLVLVGIVLASSPWTIVLE